MQVDDAAFEYQCRVEDAYKSIFRMFELYSGLSDFFVGQSDQCSHEVDKQHAPIRCLVSDDGSIGRVVVGFRDVECPAQFCCENAGIVFCSQNIRVLREIRRVTFWYLDFKIIDPEGQRLPANQDGWRGCFLKCMEKIWKVARLEPIVTGGHGLTRHVNDTEFAGINLCNELGTGYRFYN